MSGEEDQSADSELFPFAVTEDLVPVRTPKAAGQTSISFSGRLDPPLLLHEDLKEGCGGQLWPAGIVLAEYLLRNIEALRGKVMYVFLVYLIFEYYRRESYLRHHIRL